MSADVARARAAMTVSARGAVAPFHAMRVFEAAAAESPSAAVTRGEALDRIRQEITLYGTRIDVSEELSRLAGHLAEVRAILGRASASTS